MNIFAGKAVHNPAIKTRHSMVILGCLLLLLAATPMIVSAQEVMEEIRVTGTYIRRDDTYTSPVPMTAMGREHIETSGAVDLTDLMKTLPVNSGSEHQNFVTNQLRSAGTAQFNLRDLGLGATLTLLNNRRVVLSSRAANDGSQFVDINALPLNMIERIEVVKDGSSALYGSDAVAGVVNLITRNDFEGLEIEGSYQTTTEDSQEDTLFNLAYGYQGDNSSFTIFGSYMDRTSLPPSDRPELVGGTFLRPLNKSGTWVVPGAGPTRDPACGAVPGSIPVPAPPFLCLMDISLTAVDIVSAEERLAVFARGEIATEKLTLSAEVGYSDNETNLKGEHSFVSVKNNFVVPPNHPNNPFTSGGNPTPVFSFLWAPVHSLEGPNNGVSQESFRNPFDYTAEQTRVALIVEYDINDNWVIEGGIVWGKNEGQFAVNNELVDQVQLFLNGGPDGNTYLNPFGSAVVDPAQGNSLSVIDAITGRAIQDSKSEQTVLDVVVTGTLAELAAGPLGFAGGIQYRDDEIAATFDQDQLNDNFTFFGRAENFSGSQDSIAGFVEFAVPMSESINAQIAGRYEDYGDQGGSTFDPKVAIAWDVTDIWLLRGTAGTSFRAPSPVQQVSNIVTPAVVSPICLPNGMLAGRNAVGVRASGNPALEPEESTSWTLGTAVEPVENLRLSLDYFNYDYDNVITTVDPNGVLAAACAAGGFDTDPRIISAGGVALEVTLDYENQGGIEQEGIDFAIDYTLTTANAGDITLTNHTNYVMDYTLSAAAGSNIQGEGFRNANNFGRSQPEWRSNTTLRWSAGRHNVSATVRYISSYDDDLNGRDPGVIQEIDSFTTLDLQYRVLFEELFDGTLTFTIGSTNVTDEEPPRALGNGGWDAIVHDPRGRLVYARLKAAF